MKKIGLVIAIDEEYSAFLRKFDDVKEVKVGAFTVHECVLGDKEIYAVKSGAGEIIAAACAQFLITAFGVECIVNAGVCGKLSNDLKILDTVAVKDLVHYQYDTSAVDGWGAGRYAQFDSEYIAADEQTLDKFTSFCGNLRKVRCASGDKFIAADSDKEYLFKTFGAEICEMESAGILLVCKKNGVPCLIVKSVSDDCDDMDFNTYVKTASEKVSDAVVKFFAEL